LKHEKKFTTLEEKRPNALEMAEKENQESQAQKKITSYLSS
jgi:hypothetical protein